MKSKLCHHCAVRGDSSIGQTASSPAHKAERSSPRRDSISGRPVQWWPGEGRLPHLVHQTCQQERLRLWSHARTAPPGVSRRQRRQPILLVQCADHGDSDGADVRLRCARYGREAKTLARRRNPERCLERCTVRPRDSGRRDRAAQRAHGDVQPGDRGADKRACQPCSALETTDARNELARVRGELDNIDSERKVLRAKLDEKEKLVDDLSARLSVLEKATRTAAPHRPGHKTVAPVPVNPRAD
jgi:hypothetical protein